MFDLIVLSPTYYASPQAYKFFLKSALKLDYNVFIYGIGEPFINLREAKVYNLIKEIERIDTKFVLVCDSADTLLVKNETELMARFEAARCLVLMAAEKSCYPQPLLAECYPPCTSPWRFLNSGAYMGAKDNILAMLKAALRLRPHKANLYRSRDWQDDQFLLSQLYVYGGGIKLDTKCKAFQCVGDIREEEYAVADPCLFHFNGHAKGIEEQFNKRFGAENVA